MKKTVLTILLCGVMILGITGCVNADKEKENFQEAINKYGTVEKESVSTIVHKFNAELNNFEGSIYAYDNYSSISDSLYWHALHEDIVLLLL